MRLLIADDNPADAPRLRGLAESVGPEAGFSEHVTRFDAALERLRAARFDLLLLGFDLPDVEGLRSLSQALSVQPELAVVVLTDVDDDGFAEAAMVAGAQECLVRSRLDGVALDSLLRRVLTRQRHMLERAGAGERRYRELCELSRSLVCTHTLEGVLLSVNPAAAEALGYSQAEMIGRNLVEFVSESSRRTYLDHLARYSQIEHDAGLLQALTRSGQVRIWDYRNRVLRHPGEQPYVLGHALDVTERRLYERQLRELSLRDTLTGCYNRRYLVQYYGEPTPEQVWGCVVADLDHFHQINDDFGHQRGDLILGEMARFLGYHARRSDAVVRMGGDQFLLLLPQADSETTQAVVARLHSEAEGKAPCSFSLGWAVREHNEPLEKTIDRADRELAMVRVALREQDRRQRQATM
jgi:diguanylate cyclase (GGDEF)-like protein/PAS domain S-box-containing protein